MANHDYTSITELPGTLLNDEQLTRICQRYQLAMAHAGDRRVLEVACGAGIGLQALSSVAASVVGLDYTMPVLQVAQAHLHPASMLRPVKRQVPLLRGDAQRLPFAAASVDLLLNFEAIYYLAEPLAFLREAHRVLSTTGTLLLCTSNPQWPHFVPGPMTTHYPTMVELDDWLHTCGFAKISCFGAFPVVAASPVKQLISPLRKFMLNRGVIDPESRLGLRLKRLAYGKLTPLPAALHPTQLTTMAAREALVPLAPGQPDHTHRVLYCLAEK